jgi:GR25 family glycosyltransferase involved in LPS biosynthesis
MLEALVIGLDRNYRGAELEDQLGEHGIPMRRVQGVMVDDLPGGLDSHVDQAAARVLQRRELTKGEVGCALAHRAAWAALVASGNPFSLVFEDDARLVGKPMNDEIIQALQSSRPTVVVLDAYSDYTVISSHQDALARTVFKALVPPPGAWAYGLNRAAAEALLEDGRKVSSVTDWPALVAHKIEFYTVYPQLARLADGVQSTLEETRHMQEVGSAESPARKAIRLAQSIGHVRWVQHWRVYGAYRVYLNHELRRLVINRSSRARGKRWDPGNQRSPLTL